MGNQNISISIKEKKEIEKKRDGIMNNPHLPYPFIMLLPNQNRASFGITPTAANNLIPRVLPTHIVVWSFLSDVQMDSQRGRRSNVNNNNSQHRRRPTTNNGSMPNDNMELHNVAKSGTLTDARNVVARNRELLRHEEPDEGSLALHFAISGDNMDVASFLVKEYPQGSYALNRANISPLYLAVERHHLELAKEMLQLLVSDSRAPTALMKGKSIIHASVEHQNLEMLEMILNFHRDLIKRTDEQGFTPLSYAAYHGYVDKVDYIIKNVPESVSNYKNDDKSAPIHKACLGGHVEVLKKFPPNSLLHSDDKGRTILHLAAKERRNKLKHVVSYLLSLPEGQQLITKKDENGCIPLSLATKNNNDEVKRLIKNRGN